MIAHTSREPVIFTLVALTDLVLPRRSGTAPPAAVCAESHRRHVHPACILSILSHYCRYLPARPKLLLGAACSAHTLRTKGKAKWRCYVRGGPSCWQGAMRPCSAVLRDRMDRYYNALGALLTHRAMARGPVRV
jgi:hypothetical protein